MGAMNTMNNGMKYISVGTTIIASITRTDVETTRTTLTMPATSRRPQTSSLIIIFQIFSFVILVDMRFIYRHRRRRRRRRRRVFVSRRSTFHPLHTHTSSRSCCPLSTPAPPSPSYLLLWKWETALDAQVRSSTLNVCLVLAAATAGR